MPISRRVFLGAAGVTTALVTTPMLASCSQGRSTGYVPLPDIDLGGDEVDERFLNLLIRLNDEIVLDTAGSAADFIEGNPNARSTVRELKRVVSAYVRAESDHHESNTLTEVADSLMTHLESLQNTSGLFDSGNNLDSPPDSCFSLIDMTIIERILASLDEEGAFDALRDRNAELAQSVANGVAVGGAHTTNHRWEIVGALLEADALWPDDALRDRADEWLAEGIDVYDDGQYSERSTQYSSEVVNPSLIRVAGRLEDQSALDMVRENLRVTALITDDSGTVETVHSRRQDQDRRRPDWWHLLQYREFAIRDQNGEFSWYAHRIIEEQDPGIAIFLGEVLAFPGLAAVLPEPEEPDTEIETYLPDSGLLIRRDSSIGRRSTLTLFAGSDYHEHQTVASGLSTNPTFLRYRSGAAELSSVRLSPEFFSMGPIRPHSLEILADGTLSMAAEHVTGYHLPLSPSNIQDGGMYTLGGDGRFYSAMAFDERDTEEKRFDSEIQVRETGDGLVVTVEMDGPSTVAVAELCFRGEGELEVSGDHRRAEEPGPGFNDAGYIITSGSLTWEAGGDRISVSFDGIADLISNPRLAHGEMYTYMNGHILPAGDTQVLVMAEVPGTFSFEISQD